MVRAEISLKLDVGAEGGDYYWATVAVVAGIDDVLQTGCDVDAAPDVGGVVGLENILAAIVELAVTEEESKTARGEIFLVVFLDGVGDEGDAGAVLLAMPPRAIGADALREGLVDFGVGERFSLAVVPAKARERVSWSSGSVRN